MALGDVETKAVDTILQKGVRLKVRAPFLFRVLGKKYIFLKVSSPYEGTMYRVARYYLRTGLSGEKLDNLTLEEALELMCVHGKDINKAVAVAVLNGYWSGKLLTRPLAWYLRWHCNSKEIFALLGLLLLYGGCIGFYKYYQIGTSDEANNTEDGSTDAGELIQVGINSPWGIFFEIIKETGWSWHDVLWNVNRANLMLMMSDRSRFKENKKT